MDLCRGVAAFRMSTVLMCPIIEKYEQRHQNMTMKTKARSTLFPVPLPN